MSKITLEHVRIALRPESAPVYSERDYQLAISERMDKVSALQQVFVLEALRRGVSGDQLAEVTAAAMRGGVVPAVAHTDAVFRYTGLRPAVLDGEIPAEALNVWVSEGEPRVVSVDTFLDRETYKRSAFDIANESGGAFTITDLDSLEAEYGDQARAMMITRLDEVLKPFDPESVSQ